MIYCHWYRYQSHHCDMRPMLMLVAALTLRFTSYLYRVDTVVQRTGFSTSVLLRVLA
jgi:hypothetical protein